MLAELGGPEVTGLGQLSDDVLSRLARAGASAETLARWNAAATAGSADTLVYFGALEEALAAARTCLRPGGLLVFTVERWDTSGADARFIMGPHGRYMHAATYVEAALAGELFAHASEHLVNS
jgi:predicted TPR repeat methyltransferase